MIAHQIGYCTNVHAGVSLDEVKENLERYAIAVREQVCQTGSLPVGLWLSQTAAEELVSASSREQLRDWLRERELEAYTFNGFPFGDFHQAVVKHAVYQPTWAEDSRLEYTKRLAEIQAVLLSDECGTISTLPLGWPSENTDESFFVACASRLLELARFLSELQTATGKSIRVCVEPEPGCLFDRAEHLVNFFESHLLNGVDAEHVRQHLGVCHDVCHSAVMFEPQADAIKRYVDAGLVVGKVQVSSAVQADFAGREEMQKAWMLESLTSFAEPRYLHQTSVLCDGQLSLFEDLPLAIDAVDEMPEGVWRVHFHVPIFQQQFGDIGTTQGEILKLIQTTADSGVRPQWEVETYAWSVLPSELRKDSLADCITRELNWFQKKLIG